MPQVPAFCDRCGAAFPSGINVENSTNIGLYGCRSGPCPKCGGMGSVLDGIFNVIGNTIEIVSAPSRTYSELSRLAEIISTARRFDLSRTEVSDKIKKDLPNVSATLLSLLPVDRIQWYAFLAVLLAIVQIYLAAFPPEAKPASTLPAIQITEEQVASQILRQERPKSSPSSSGTSEKKIGRNEACRCGSGKKYKKCCLTNK